MKPKKASPPWLVDKRRVQTPDPSQLRRPVPPDRRAHVVLLGYYGEDQARQFLQGKGLPDEQVEELMKQWDRAQARVKKLPPLGDPQGEALPLDNREALAEIERAMARPDCKEMFRDGRWIPKLVNISKLVPFQPNLDVDYADSLGGSGLSASNMMSAVKLCFSSKRSTALAINVEDPQKAITISGVNPTLQVSGVQYGQQSEDGPFVVNLFISAGPNLVQVSQYRGRYLLSSGYHRVYKLLKAGFSHVPCLAREARALAETGASGPGFFPESVLMAPRPPLFPDFADKELGIVVPLRAVRKVIRIRPDEYFLLR